MSLIKCLGECKYQRDGYCALESVADWQGAGQGGDCVYRTNAQAVMSAEDGGDGLGNITG